MTSETPKLLAWLDRGFAGSILLLALAAPLSIAATQTAWALALLFWLLRLFYVRPSFARDGIPLAVLGFVGLSLVSSIFSYEPEVSLRKMVAVSLVSIVFLVSSAVKTDKLRRLTTIILLGAATVGSVYSLANAAIGRNLKVLKMTAESPLRAWGIQENDTIQRADGVSVNSPEELSAAIAANSSDGNVELKVYRFEVVYTFNMPIGYLSPASEPGYLGITDWSRGRDIRASGFYGHYTTFAEALQLVGSLALGMLIMAPGGLFARNRLLLAAAVVLMTGALVLTVTRASWGGFALSAAIMVLVGASRKVI
ncbi:MAG: PDZ domain-containing protein, partial [Pyrinomonadaceae bacterium]